MLRSTHWLVMAAFVLGSGLSRADEANPPVGGEGVIVDPAIVAGQDGGEQAGGELREGFVEPRNPHLPTRGPWYLGVYGSYTPTGMLLTEVYPRTTAARAGLEPGDRILTVNGYQVGVVNGTRVPIDLALQRYTSRSGFVRLLVQDRRTQRLVNLDVQLTRSGIHTFN